MEPKELILMNSVIVFYHFYWTNPQMQVSDRAD